MDKAVQTRLFWGFVSGWISRLSSTIIQLVGVPVFLHYWSVPVYGEWLILNAIPSYLSFSNIGFGSVASNEMTMMAARKDYDGAIRVFQSCWMLILLACLVVGALCGAALYAVPVGKLLNIHTIDQSDARGIILYLGVAVLLGQLEQLLQSAYTCIGRYPYGSFLKSMISLIAFGATMAAVALHRSPREAALWFAAANIAGTLLLIVLVKRDVPWISYGWKHASWSELRRMWWPAITFMGFPIGNALNLQGTVMAVNYVLGPSDVVIFSTARTVSRVALQMVQMVNSTFWPELSIAFGSGDTKLLQTLHRRACQIAMIIAVFVITGAMSLGPWFLTHWTHGHVPPSRGLLAIMLSVVALYALWSTSSTLHAAINKHQTLSAYYIVGTSISLLVTYLLAKRFGLYGAAFSLLLPEIAMNSYVLPWSIRLTHDTMRAFLNSMFTFPDELQPAVLLQKLKRKRA